MGQYYSKSAVAKNLKVENNMTNQNCKLAKQLLCNYKLLSMTSNAI